MWISMGNKRRWRLYTIDMNKKLLLLMATIGGIAGAYVPVLFGDSSLLDGWMILTSTIGGLLGIWAGVKISKRYGI